MVITYKKLKDGYVLTPGDIIDNIHGIQGYCVRNDGLAHAFYLKAPDDNNHIIYNILQIKPAGEGGLFPELPSLSDLTKEVIRLFETSPFKEGDRVRIVKRVKDAAKYPFNFIDEMAVLEGQIFTIDKIDVALYDFDLCEGDPHEYVLRDSGGWTWHSSMFEKVYDEKCLPEELVLDESTEVTPIHISVQSSTIKIVL